MFTVMFRLVMLAGLVAVAADCGGGEKIVKTVTKDPKKKEAKQLVVEARDQASAGKLDQADRSYGEAYATANDSPKLAWEILQEWVEFLGHASRPGRARDVAKQYYDTNPADPKGYGLYAETLLRSNKPQDALDVASQLIQLNAEDASGHDKRGRALLILERMDEAVEALRKAVELEPANARYHMSLGMALHQMGDVNKAALEFRAALKSAPDDAEAHVLLGMALRDQTELEEAKTYLDKALELDPKSARAWFEMGVLYNRQGKQIEAEAALSNAVKLAPNESRYWYAYGEIYRVQAQSDQAQAQPDHAKAQLDHAIKAYRRAVEIDPPFPKAVGKLGIVLVDNKQYDEAEPYLIQAIRKDPKNALNYWYLGAAYAALKKNRQAIDNYELFLRYAAKDDRDRGRAKEFINQLKRR